MFRLCLFDLDNTLVSTDDVEELRLASKKPTEVLLKQITAALEEDKDRVIYSRELLEQIRADFPKLMLGVFSGSLLTLGTILVMLMCLCIQLPTTMGNTPDSRVFTGSGNRVCLSFFQTGFHIISVEYGILRGLPDAGGP